MSTVARNVDFRSDTVTKPTATMRQAMLNCEVGDDVFCEDPTVLKLEERVAKLFGKESALFFPSGTMSNLTAVLAWCGRRGSEMILGDSSHIHVYEQGGVSQFGGVATHMLPNLSDGSFDLGAVEAAIRVNNVHYPTTDLIAIENTHNYCGGRIVPDSFIKSLREISKKHNIPIHMDGARIWNAASALQKPMKELVRDVDSITACLSKGLGAPAGSLLIGPKEFILQARRTRKALGGGMRQVGVLAAAGLCAIDDFEAGILLRDHQLCKKMAKELAAIPSAIVNPDESETNMVVMKFDPSSGITSDKFMEKCKEKGVYMLARGTYGVRLVVHRDVTEDDITQGIAHMQLVINQLRR
jgi:threonine aldolase